MNDSAVWGAGANINRAVLWCAKKKKQMKYSRASQQGHIVGGIAPSYSYAYPQRQHRFHPHFLLI